MEPGWRKKLKQDISAGLFCVFTLVLLAADAQAVQIKRVQRGMVNFDADDVVQSVTLTNAVDQSKSIILLTNTGDTSANTRDQNWFFTGQFESNETIAIDRAGGTSPASVLWEVIEFEDGVRVQRGISSMQATGSANKIKNITLPITPIDTTKAVPIVQTRAAFTTITQTHEMFLLPTFPDANTLRLERKDATGTKAIQIVWQVIEFLYDATVQTGAVTIAINTTSNTATISSVSNPIIFTNFTGNTAVNGIDAELYVTGELTNPTTLTFTRGYGPNTAATEAFVQYYVVDLTDGSSTVQTPTAHDWATTPAGQVAIGGATNAAPIVMTTATHTYATGNLVNIYAVAGNVAANGNWFVTVPNNTTFSLDGSDGTTSGAYSTATDYAAPAITSTITAVDATRTMVMHSRRATSGTTNTAYADDFSIGVYLFDSTTLATIRAAGVMGASSRSIVSAIQFTPITVKTPNGGETLIVNDNYDITWRTAASIANVKLEYSDDNGGTWKTIIASTPASGNTYAWTVGYDSTASPILPALEKETDCLVRVSNAADSTQKDVSNAAFTIKSKLSMTSPNGSELWYVGDNRSITWSKWGNFDSTVKLQYSIDAPHAVWTDVTGATTQSAGAGSFAWNPIPLAAAGTTVKVRVLSNTNADVLDDSNANFENRGSISLTAPIGTSEWPTGYPQTISWTLNSNTDNVHIYYSLDNGGNYTQITTGGPVDANNVDATHGTYGWTPPLASVSALSKIKVVDSADANVLGESATFSIIASIKVDQPNGGEVWKVDEVKKIKWTIGGGYILTPYVTLDYCKNYTSSCQAPGWVSVSGGGQVDASIGGAGFDWTVPDAITLTPTVRVKIEKYTVPSIFDESDAGFTIKGSITMIQPASAIKVPTNQNFTITWTPHGNLSTAYGNNFKVEYSNNGGTSYTDVYTGINGDAGSATWLSANIPIDNLGQADSMIKVGLSGDDSAPNGVYGESAAFYIRGNIAVTSPNGGQSFNISNLCQVRWTPHPAGLGALGAVRIAYSKNSGTDGYPDPQVISTGLDASVGSTTGYDWTIPDADLLYETIRIQVRLASDPTSEVRDDSDNDFTINGNLTLTRPSTNFGDPQLTWACGTQENITWSHQGSSMQWVDLYYSKDNGTDLYVNAIDTTSQTPATGDSYTWTIPSDGSVFKTGDNGKNTSVAIKLALRSNPSGVYSTTATGGTRTGQALTIKSRFTTLVPNGGDITVGSPFNITWVTQGDVATVNVKYSTDGGGIWGGDISPPASSNAGGWNWNPVNCPLDNDIRVKVESASHPNDINLSSAQNITSKGKLEITSPNSTHVGASALFPGQNDLGSRITWITNGGLGSNVGLVDLYFAADGTTFGTPFASVDTAVANFYDWTVPSGVSIPGTTNKIKIVAQSPADGSVNDLSDAFDIRGKLWNGTTNHAMVAPNGGEVYYVGGSNIDVQWRYKGNIGDCDISYSTNGGGSYPTPVATVPHNNLESGGISHYFMTVPSTAGITSRVKILSVNDSTNVYAASQNNFAVKGQIVLNSPGKAPGSPELWYVDGNNQISFTITGGISTVDILFDKNSGRGANDSPGDADDYGTFTIASGLASVNGVNNYGWTIPSNEEATRQLVTTNKARVRVRDANDTTVYADSTNDFYMKPKVAIGTISDSPWTVEGQKTITWATTGAISQLNLYYSPAGQSGPWGSAQITGITASGGSTPWTIPTTAVSWGNAVLKLVRYESGVEDTDVTSLSPNFTIKGKINVTAPLTNQTYNVQQTGQITWNVVGAVGNVDIKYNTNSGGGYPDIDWVAFAGATGIVPDYCTNVPGTPYTFTIPSSTAANVKVRVVESSHAEVFGPQMAGSPTHKFKGSIVFDKPTAGAPNTKNQTITIGQTPHRIDWSLVGTFTTLKAYYKKIGDAQWTQVGADLGGTITNTNYSAADADITATNGSNKVLFRVEDALDASDVYAETPSGEGNTIIGALSMLEPITPAEFTVGSTVQVKWKKYGNIGNLKFELWNGTAWLDNAGGSNLSDSYASGTSGEGGVIMVPDWAVPDKIGTGRVIRVTSLTYPALTGETGPFSIKGGFNSIVTPGTWYVGEDHTISWQANGTMSSVKIDLYDGSGWQTIAASYDNGGLGLSNGANNYPWSGASTAQQQRCNNCRIKVTSNQNTNVSIETLGFTLVPRITVTTPASSWIAESSSNIITWDAIAAPTTNVDVILNDNNSGVGYPVTLAGNIVKGLSPYTSTVPLPATLTNAAFIRVRDTSFPALVYGDTGTFKVIGQIIMHPVDNTPNSTSNWEAGSTTNNVTWSSKGNLGNVNIRYKYNGGAYSAPINGVPIPVTDGSFNWTPIPNVISENVQVKIESVNNPAEEYAESAAFKIKGKFTLSDPGTLLSGAGYTIAWTNPVGQSTQITDVILEFYNGTGWSYLVASPYTVPNTESYSWTVPTNVQSFNCKFRISDPDNSSATDETVNFEIRPIISVTAPTSAAEWLIGTQTGNNIVWSITGPVPTVTIRYSKDGGVDNYAYEITPSVAGNSSPFEWNIPTNQDIISDHTAGPKAKIRVSDTSIPAVYGDSALFMVKGSITITSPTGATVWKIGDATNIAWTTPCTGACNMGNVKIEFRKSATDAWGDVTTVPFSSSPQTAWSLPLDAITNNQKTAVVRITQVANSVVATPSAGFEIEGKITINEPDTSGLMWAVGSQHNIKWTPIGTYTPVEIQYSTDDFNTSVIAIDTVANSASGVQSTYVWTIPTNLLSDTVKVRVRDDNDDDVNDVSAYTLKLVGGLDLTSPESDSPKPVWYKGESHDITWVATGAVTTVDIDYSTNGGTGWTNIVTAEAGHIAGSNSKAWTIPDENSENCVVRVSDSSHAAQVNSVSAYPFSVRPLITVSQPTLDQNAAVGGNTTIAWSLNGSTKVSYVKLYYSKNGGAFTNVIDETGTISAPGGTFNWTNIPDDISTDIKARVVDNGNPNVYGTSASFDIIGSITVQQPDSTVNWLVGTTDKNITWLYTGDIGTVDIFYKYGAGSYAPIASGIPKGTGGSGSWNWLPAIPDNVSNNVQVKVASTTNGTEEFDESEVFKIRGGFTNLKFQSDEVVLNAGTEHTIVWTKNGTNLLNAILEFSSNNGTDWSYINPVNPYLVPNTGGYTWTAPTAGLPDPAPNCLIRITDPNNPAATVTSSTFEIRAVIVLTDPVGTDEWVAGTVGETIAWTTTGVVQNVNVQYSKDNGSNWISVRSGIVNIGATTWDIPTDQDLRTANQAKVRVSNSSYETVYGDSLNFKMKGTIGISAPVGTDILKVGDAFNLQWATVGFSTLGGTADDVVIGYSTNGGTTFTPIATVDYNYGAPAGTYPWTPPVDSITPNALKQAKIEVKDYNDPIKTRGVSAGFDIEGKVVINEPDTAGLMWTVGSQHNIKWTPTGTFTPVEFHYSTDNFVTSNIFIDQATNSASGVEGTYPWTIPTNLLTDTARVRVRDANDSDVKDISSFDIKLIGGLDVTSPESQTPKPVWYKGESHDITWVATGAVTTVDIDYSTNGGTGWTNLVSGEAGHTAGSNSKPWTIPDENSENCVVRVSDSAHAANVYSISAYPFSIRPVITVSQPTLDQNLSVGGSSTIAWNLGASTKVSYVKIYYSKDGGADVAIDDTGTISGPGGTYNWTNIPDAISTDIKVKVVDNGNSNVYGVSASFDIIGSLTVQQPDATANWLVGTTDKNITWTYTGDMGTLDIFYKYDAGSYAQIASGIPKGTGGAGSWNWPSIPDSVSNNVMVKVASSANGAEEFDESASFKIRGGFTNLKFQSDEVVLNAGSEHTIVWTKNGSSIVNAVLEFSSNNGTNWSYINPVNPYLVPNTGGYTWTAPTAGLPDPAPNCLIRITDPNNPAATVTSSTFEIRAVIVLTDPVGTDEWVAGTVGETIAWTTTGVVQNVNVRYSKDNGSNWTSVRSGIVNTGSTTWDIPTDQDFRTANQAKVRVSNSSYETVYGDSLNFKMKGTIGISAPVGTDILKVGDAFNLQWATVGFSTLGGTADDVVIGYSTNGGTTFTPIATVDYNYGAPAGTYPWTPPVDSITPNALKQAKIEVKDYNDPIKTRGVSAGFDIEGKVVINDPDTSGIIWTVGTQHLVRWTPTGTYTPVEIQYSTDNFTTNIYPVATVANSASGVQGSYNWTIPTDVLSDTAKVRVSDDNDDDVNDVSAFNIKLVGGLDLTAPESLSPKTIWYKGQTQNITWSATGAVTNVNLDYKTATAGSWSSIISNDGGHTAGANSYSWPIPDENSEDCYVRVSDTAHPNDVFAVSENPFSIRPVITIAQPALDQNVGVGSNTNIAWSLNGSTKVSFIKLYYSKDGGGFTNVINDSGTVDATTGSYSWNNVPDAISTDIKVRIQDNGNPNVYSDSASFDIIGSLTVQQPDATANWLVGTTDKNITWTYTGDMGTLDIFYKYDAGAYALIATGISKGTGGAGSWNWPSIPDSVSNNVMVKVASSANGAEEFDESASFKIRGGFTNLKFQSDEVVLNAGSEHTIVWTKNGSSIVNAVLEFSSNNGTNWSYINPIDPYTVSNTGSYTWTAPTSGLPDPAGACLIRITDPNNATATVTSSTFEIRAVIVLTDPVGTDEWIAGTVGETIAWTTTGVVQNVNVRYSKDNGSNWISVRSGIVNTGSTTWDIPSDQDYRTPDQAKIRVSNSSYATVYGDSLLFKMKGTIGISAPVGTDILKVGDAFNLQWTTGGFTALGGTADDVVIGYSTNGGTTFTPIATVDYNYGAPAGTYPWTPPIDSITPDNLKQAKIEVKDYNDPIKTRGVSAGFDIEGKVRIDSPDIDAPTWFVGDPQQIKWTPTGTFGYVKIEYSSNGFTNESATVVEAPTYANSAHNVQAAYNWTIPNLIGSNFKVRISDVNDANVVDVSASPFIIKGKVVVTEPNGGETWYVGDTTRKIRWQATGPVPTVRIEYSKNNGGLWTEIIADAPAGAGAGEYTWASVADAISEQCLMRVSSTSDSTVIDPSNSVFFIKGKLQVTAPDANTRWVAGSSGNAITWVRTGSIANVRIDYAVDGGLFTNVITPSTSAANQTFTWNNLPNHVSNSYIVKITDLNDPNNVSAVSPSFKIVGSVTVTAPLANAQIKVGQNLKIEWSAAGDFANVRIEYSGNGGTSFDYQIIDLTSTATLFYWWNNIPADKVSPNVVLKVTDANDILTTDNSDPFKVQGIFDVLTPDGGQTLVVGSDYNITWSTTGTVTQVNLDYSTNSGLGWTPITGAPIANTGAKLWTVPDAISDFCRVRVSDANDADAKDTSAGDFFIKGKLQITSPTDSTGSWLVGTTQPITWQVTGTIANVKLEFSVDGAAYEPIPTADNLPATPSSFDWQIPDRISSQVRVKITNKNDPTVFDESNDTTPLSITGQLNLTAPVGGETWYVGDQNTISWTKIGTITGVNLQYSVAGGTYADITDAQNLTGSSFNWILPDIVSSQVRVKAINANPAKPTTPGISGLLTVKGKLVLTNPVTAGVVWDVNIDKSITWTRTGSVGNIRLEYDYGSGFATIAGAENLASSLLTFTWNVPNTISDNVVLRIVPINANEADPDDSVSFKIAADLQLTSPLGGEVWVVDDNQPVTWIRRGTIANVVLKYDTAAGLGGYPNTIATRPAGDGSYSWPVPDAIGDQLRVRIENAVASSTVPDTSPANFAIRGSVLVTRPVGTGPSKQVWIAETQENINYTIHGSIASVEIRYSLDDGGTYPADKIIAPSEAAGPGNKTYLWTVPVYTSTLAKVKVTALGYSNIYDESDTFTIRGGFTMVHPLLNERWQANSIKLIEWNTLGNIPQVYLRYSLNNGQAWAFVNDGSAIANIGNYNWTIPNVISTQALIKIADVNDALASTDSDTFFIHGAVTLTQPNGQEKFKGGQSDNASKIKWTMQGPIPGVDLALSTTGANGTYTTFATNQQASLLEYQWSVPTNVLSSNCFIRIQDTNDALVEDKSDLAFKIMDNIVVSAPSGGEKWVVGTQPNITWTSLGLAPEVNIKYCIEPTLTQWQPVASNVPNAANGSYPWTIPSTISATTRVRLNAVIGGSEDADSVAISAADFMIKGSIIVAVPNGGTGPTYTDKEKWGADSQQWIRWTSQGNIDKVDIHYYNGSTWVTIDPAQGITNIGEFQWTIPAISTSGALIRVRDNNVIFRDEVYDISDNPFKIMGRVVITQPNGSEVWYAGSTGNIMWSKYGPASFNTVRIDYSVNDPTFTTPQSITTSTPNSGTYDWLNIPAEAVSGNVRIRVAKPDDLADVSDTSDGDFRIRANFTLNTPNGAQKWVVGDTQTISWSQVGNTQDVKFTYYKQTNPAINGTFTLNNPYTTGTWTYDWTVPNFIHSDLLMKVEDPNDNGAFDLSDAVFKIMPGFTVTLPNANSSNEADYKWYVGDPAAITWTYTGTVDQVGIYYSLTGGIEGSWVSLTSANASDLSWPWSSVPNAITTQLKVKVGAANDADAFGVSQGMSRIRAKFALTAPAGGEELVVGDPFNIVWTNVGTVSNVDLHYSLDNFATAGLNIQLNYGNGANGGNFPWTVPDNISQTVRVRVRSTADTDAFKVSPEFRIKGSVWVNAPVLNDAWEIGQGKQVKWGWKGTIPNIKITYSLLDDNGTPGNPADDFQGPFNLIQENVGTPNDGSITNGTGSGGAGFEATYTWTIPDEANNNVLLKVADARPAESDIEDTSGAFKIIGYLIAKTPTANEKLAVQSVYQIRWEWGGTMPEVGITLSTNGFTDENQNFDVGTVPNAAGAGGPGSEHYYDWTVPDHISPNCKLRIYDPRVPSVNSVSPVFKIQGAFTLTAPAPELNNNGTSSDGSDDFYEIRWVTNELRDITWTTFGTIGSVDLVYAKDFNTDGVINDTDFAQEIPMVNGTNINNDGSFSWVVPNERYSSPPYYVPVKVRVYDHNDHDVYVQGPTPANGVDTVKIDYYRITWDIRDLVTNQPVAGLTVADDSGWNAQGLSSPVIHYVPAGYWTASWTHRDYGPISESYLTGWDTTANVYRKDRTIFRTMETLVVHIWRAFSEFSYDVPTDKLFITSWLERDGSLVPGAQIIDVSIYDGNERIQRRTVLVDEVNNKHLYHTAIPDTVKLWTGTRLNNNGTPLNPDDDFEEVRTMDNVIADSALYKNGEMTIPAAFSGFFGQNWTPTTHVLGGATQPKLQSGKVYTVVTYMGISTGATFRTPVSFSVTIPVTMEEVSTAVEAMQATVNSTLDKPISEVDANLRRILAGDNADLDEIAAQGGIKGIVEDKLDAQVEIIQTAADNMQAAFDEVLISFETSTNEAIALLREGATAVEAAGESVSAAGDTIQATAEKYSWRVTVAPNPALTGDTVTIQLTGLPSKIPLLDVYSHDDKVIFDDVTFTETTPGVYSYEFKAGSKFKAGKAYSYVVVESTTSGFITGSAMVESMSLTTIAGLAAAAPEAERVAKKALEAIKNVEAVVVSGENINISMTLKNLKESVDALPEQFAKEGVSPKILDTVEDISSRIKTLAGNEGYDLGQLFEKTLTESPSIKDLRMRTEEINSVIELLQELFESKFGGKDAPVVSTSVEGGSVVFRIFAVNPSKVKPQKVQIKNYLLEEVKPRDIMDLNGLELEYDAEKSLYYVYKNELELAPGEVRAFRVHVEDIWFVAQSTLSDLRERVSGILSRLEKSEYYAQAKAIGDSIFSRLDYIATSQGDDSMSREQHIGLYRENVKTVEAIKEDIAKMEKILVTAGGPPAPEMLAKTRIKANEPTKTMTWIVIFLIVIFVGLLAGVLFFTWYSQTKVSKEELISARKSAFPESAAQKAKEKDKAEASK